LKRLVLDAGTLASGIVVKRTESPPGRLFVAVRDIAFELVVCPQLLEELRRTLRKPYFGDRISAEEAATAVALIERAAMVFADPADVEPILRDPTDDYLVALAREAAAEAIVTGDKDLLEHTGLEPPAITARAACELLGLTETPVE
jgi:putative PIN family toxin of toxin-antitoxin system